MLNFNEVRDNNQNGHHNGNGTFIQGGGDQNISTAVGFVHIYRFPTMVPLEATGISAILRVPVGVKNGDSSQSVSYTVSMVSTVNAPPLVNGEAFNLRPREGATTHTVTYTTGTQVWSNYAVDVTSLITSFMGKPGYTPGAYVIFALTVTAESGDINLTLDYKAFGGEKPTLQITYTPATNPTKTVDFNLLDNPTGGADAQFWGENAAFGTFNVGGSFAVDNSFVRRAGVPTIKYTVPPTNPDSKPATITHGILVPGNSKQYIFCGWMWAPTAFTGNIYPQFLFEWNGGHPVIGRNQWVPFCTALSSVMVNPTGITPSIHLDSGYTAGMNFWLSDCAVYESKFRQMPFTGTLPDARTIDYHYTWAPGKGVSTRTVNSDLSIKGVTDFTKTKKYVLNSAGIWTLTENTRQSTSWDDLEANGMTWDALKATGKTWDDMEADTTIV